MSKRSRFSWFRQNVPDTRPAAGPAPVDPSTASSDFNTPRAEGDRAWERLDSHPLFDSVAYMAANPDVVAAGMDPFRHFVTSGARQGRRPHPLFDASWYLARYPHAHRADVNPLAHYLDHGWREGYDPHPLFDGAAYLADNPDVAEAGVNPLLHFVSSGADEGRRPHPLFDLPWYVARYPDVSASGRNPLIYYLEQGWKDAHDPHPLFNGTAYLRTNTDVAAAVMNPLLHFVTAGFLEGRNPHPLFDTCWYLERYPEVAGQGVNPLVHYLTRGWQAGYDPHPLFRTSWYLERNVDVVGLEVNPLLHFMFEGARQGRSPHQLFETAWYISEYGEDAVFVGGGNPLTHYLERSRNPESPGPNRYFDPAWYLASYPDVAAAGLEPLTHYSLSGASQNRRPSARFDPQWYLATYPDVRHSGIEALQHFLSSGEAEHREPLPLPATQAPLDTTQSFPYTAWLTHARPTLARSDLQRRLADNFAVKPVVSLIVPVYIVDASVFKALVRSVFDQTYPRWELCIAVAYFEDKALLDAIEAFASLDERIKVCRLPENRGISHNSNDALSLASGEFVALLDHDDTLPSNALYEVVHAINKYDADLYYSDKDAITEDGTIHFAPLFKPAWSPELMLSANYLTHFNVIRRSFVDQVGGWDPATDGAQDWDLFLRVAAAGARINHVPAVLYHWRHVQTSVAARGLEAKPYAQKGQFEAVRRWLRYQGWSAALPFATSTGYMRIRWGGQWTPSITVILFAGAGGEAAPWRTRLDQTRHAARTAVIGPLQTRAALSDAIRNAPTDILVVVPAALSPIAPEWLDELVAPLENSQIAAVCGKVLDPAGQVLDAGWVAEDNVWRPLFRGAAADAFSVFGALDWFRNLSAISMNGVAYRTSAVAAASTDGWVDADRPDLELANSLAATGHRLVYNPFATSVVPPEALFETSQLARASAGDPISRLDRDLFFHKALTLDARGTPVLRPLMTKETSPSSHNYEAEAAYFGATLDYDTARPAQMHAITVAPRADATQRVAWLVPHFTMPFYGGLLTILRVAEYLRRQGIRPVFIGVGTSEPEQLRNAIRLAYPELASESQVFGIGEKDDVNALGIGYLDSAFATLWTTAYTLRAMHAVGRKFYFVQDYEPLFYPAGTTSAMVEATYRFGFYGICNTAPLQGLYCQFGSPADYFLPQVDASIFHDSGRITPASDEPVTIFSYARPGHPRNCFEILAPALRQLKLELGGQIRIFTAGADWNPQLYGLEFAVEHLGLMAYHETGELYRACDIGLVAMATCHPSYLPLELMASGAVVCTNHNRYTTWLLEHEENCQLFELSRTSVVTALRRLVTDPAHRARLASAGRRTIDANHSDWDAACKAVYRIMGREGGFGAARVPPIESAM